MAFKLNNADNYEHLANVILTKEKFPIAWNAKVEELMEEDNLSRKDAEQMVRKMEIQLELYYEKGYGLFAVESEVVDTGTIYSPYSKELGEDADVDC